MNARAISAVLFDCDGVLVDSETASCSSLADLLTRHGVSMTEADVRARFLGRPIDAVTAYARSIGRPLPDGFVAEKDRAYFERARGSLTPIDGAHRVVSMIAARLPVAVVTSGTPEKVAFSLRETRLDVILPHVFTSSMVTRGKPAPDLFLLAARRLGVDPEACVVVEDSTSGVAAGRAAGMLTVGLTSSLDAEALRAAGADRVIARLEELLAIVGAEA